ncbi:MAG: amidohydrolase family protein [Deltaproteobacteria bacterium]|nr:amidohydrolase family protein [Deltaproteobacteria bacterium]
MIDSHTHIFPPEIRSDRDSYLERDPAFRILYGSPRARLIGAGELIDQMDSSGIDCAVTFGFPWQDVDLMRRHNDYVGEAASRFKGRLLPFVCVNPVLPGAAFEVERCLAAGMKGAGEIACYDRSFGSDLSQYLLPIGSCCQSYDVPLMLHTNEEVGHQYPGKVMMPLKAMYEVVRSLPGTRFILAHWGGGLFFYELLKKEVREVLARVAYDTAASPFLYESAIYAIALRIVGPKRILFGSDYPLISPQRYFIEMEEGGLSESDMKWIKGDAAALWIGGQGAKESLIS